MTKGEQDYRKAKERIDQELKSQEKQKPEEKSRTGSEFFCYLAATILMIVIAGICSSIGRRR